MCGVRDPSASLEAVAVFANSYFNLELNSCDDFFLKMPFRPTSNVTRLRLPAPLNDTQVIQKPLFRMGQILNSFKGESAALLLSIRLSNAPCQEILKV